MESVAAPSEAGGTKAASGAAASDAAVTQPRSTACKSAPPPAPAEPDQEGQDILAHGPSFPNIAGILGEGVRIIGEKTHLAPPISSELLSDIESMKVLMKAAGILTRSVQS